ncbi:FAD:protein FMN transferase [Saltatorellus ferox]
MGTSWSAVVEVPRGTSGKGLGGLIQGRLDAVDLAMSTWKEGSDLSRFNRAGAGDEVAVGQLTLDVMALCGPLVEVTGGAFDPTVRPLVEVWGFGSYDDVEDPSPEEIQAALGLVGWGGVEVRDGALVKARDGIEVDLSAVAKGYAVDLAAAALVQAGASHFLLECGGEMVLRGKNTSGEMWRVGIDDPLLPEGADPLSPMNFAPRPPFARLSLTGSAVATSGDYRNVRKVEGRIVAHAIDPRTGQPIDHDLASVTVVADSCARADALATAALVLGPDRALALLESEAGVEGYLLTRVREGEKTTLAVTMTPGMEALVMPPIPGQGK